MPMLNSIQEVVDAGLCISCGACAVAAEKPVEMRELHGMSVPDVTSTGADWGTGIAWRVCPGRGYNIAADAQARFPDAPHADLDLGRWHAAWACHATAPEILARASSGGVMTAVAAHLLDSGQVDAVAVTHMVPSPQGPRGQTRLATTPDELYEAQGSKYIPVPALEVVAQIRKFAGRVAFIGTPCQVAGLRLLQREDPALASKVVVTIANFCGGFRDLRETDRIIERAGHAPRDVVALRFRGEGQPGVMRIEDRDGRVSRLPYPDYVRATGITKHLRCRLCVDATGELADLSFGDAWIPRYLQSGSAWSLVLARTAEGAALLESMRVAGELVLDAVRVEEIRHSQAGNLESKKKRQGARRRLMGWLRVPLPNFDGGYAVTQGGLLFELRVLLSQILLTTLERLHLYPTVARLTGRWPLRPKKRRSAP